MIKARLPEMLLVLLTLLIALTDSLFCRGFSLWVLYLVPIGIAAWLKGFRHGLWMAALSVVCLIIDGVFVGNPFVSWGMYLYALTCRALAFVVIAALSGRLRLVHELEHQVRAYEELCDALHISPPASSEALRKSDKP